MTIKNLIFVVLFRIAVWGALFFQSVTAQDNEGLSIDFSLREQATGPVFQAGEGRYQIIPRAYAVLEEASSNLISAVGDNTSRLYGNYGSYQIFIALNVDIPASAESAFWSSTEERYRVALSIDHSQPVIVTGQIVAHMFDFNASRAVADAYGLTIEAEFQDIGRVFFGARSDQNVIELTELLNADIAVRSAEIDIIEEFYEPF